MEAGRIEGKDKTHHLPGQRWIDGCFYLFLLPYSILYTFLASYLPPYLPLLCPSIFILVIYTLHLLSPYIFPLPFYLPFPHLILVFNALRLASLPISMCFSHYTCSSVLHFPLRGLSFFSPLYPGSLLPSFTSWSLAYSDLPFIILNLPPPMRCCLASLDYLSLAPLARVIERPPVNYGGQLLIQRRVRSQQAQTATCCLSHLITSMICGVRPASCFDPPGGSPSQLSDTHQDPLH